MGTMLRTLYTQSKKVGTLLRTWIKWVFTNPWITGIFIIIYLLSCDDIGEVGVVLFGLLIIALFSPNATTGKWRAVFKYAPLAIALPLLYTIYYYYSTPLGAFGQLGVFILGVILSAALVVYILLYLLKRRIDNKKAGEQHNVSQ